MFCVPQRIGIHKDRWKKTSGNNTAGELKVLENSLDFFFLGPQGPLRRPAKPQLSFRKLWLSPLLGSFTSSMRLSRRQGCQCWLPFSVPMAKELGETGFYRFQQPCWKKKTARRYACMHAGAFVDRLCRIDQLPLYVSFHGQLCRVCFLHGPAFSHSSSLFSPKSMFFSG